MTLPHCSVRTDNLEQRFTWSIRCPRLEFAEVPTPQPKSTARRIMVARPTAKRDASGRSSRLRPSHASMGNSAASTIESSRSARVIRPLPEYRRASASSGYRVPNAHPGNVPLALGGMDRAAHTHQSLGAVYTPPASPVFTTPRGSTSMMLHSRNAMGRCSIPFGTIYISPARRRTD